MLNILLDAWSSLIPPWSCASVRPEPRSQFEYGCHGDGKRTLHYRLFIPGGRRQRPMPLIVMLHGCSQDASDFARGTGMNALAERHGFLVLYPEQSANAHWNRCWNWYDRAHHVRGKGEPALIAGLTRHVMAEHPVDPKRVAVAGLSAGGAMAVILGRTYPDLFGAVGCHSGMAHGSATSGAGAMLAMRNGPGPSPQASARPGVPVIVFHGDADTTVHRSNGSGVVRQSVDSQTSGKPDTDAGVFVVEETGRTDGRTFTRRTHHGSTGGILAEHWTVHGAGHAWSGGEPGGTHTDMHGPKASEEMLRFFSNCLAA